MQPQLRSGTGPAGRSIVDAIRLGPIGVGLIFVIASGLAIGWGASIERLTSEGDAVPELVAAQGDTRPMSAAVVERDMFGQPIAVIRRHPGMYRSTSGMSRSGHPSQIDDAARTPPGGGRDDTTTYNDPG